MRGWHTHEGEGHDEWEGNTQGRGAPMSRRGTHEWEGHT